MNGNVFGRFNLARNSHLNSWRKLATAVLLAGVSLPALADPPVVTGFSPTSGSAETIVTIEGTGFGSRPEENTVTLGGEVSLGAKLLRVLSASPTRLTAVVPPYSRSNKIRVEVAGNWGQSNAMFVVAPDIRLFSPMQGLPESSLEIRGMNFDVNPVRNLLRINGVPATVVSASTGSLHATIPTGATSGLLDISTDELTGNSKWPIEILSTDMRIDGFSPGAGTEGSTVVIKGKAFGWNPANNAVSIDGLSAQIVAASDTQLSFVVPAGAHSGPITVTANGKTVTTDLDFHIAQPGVVLTAGGPVLQANVSQPGGHTDLTFDALAGESMGVGISAAVQTPSNFSRKPYAALLKPDGSTLRQLYCESTCVLEASSLPVSGTYIVRLFANNPSSTLNALVALRRTIESALTPGEPIDLELSDVGQIWKLQFSGVEGSSKSLEFWPSGGHDSGRDNQISVTSPDGSLLSSEGSPINCWSPCGRSYFLHDLPATGTYTITIRKADARSERIQVRLIDPVALEVDGAAYYGQSFLGHQMGLMTFPALAGQRLDLGILLPITWSHQSNFYSSYRAWVTLFDPDGVQISEFILCKSITGPININSFWNAGCSLPILNVPRDGNYTVAIRRSSIDASAVLTPFIATVSTPYIANASVDGDEVALNLARPGQPGLIRFDGTQGQNLQLNAGPRYNSDIPAPMTLYGPSGNALLTLPAASFSGAIDLPTLPEDGTYVLEEGTAGRTISEEHLHLPIRIKSLHSCSERASAIFTSTALGTVTPAEPIVGESFSVSALVTPRSGVCGAATGTVRITIQGTSNSCSYQLPAQTSCTLLAPRAGFLDLRLEFLPSDPAVFAPSSRYVSRAVTVLRKPVVVRIVNFSPEPVQNGQTLTTVVEVNPMQSGGPAPTGRVSVISTGGRACDFMLPSTSCTMTQLVPGVRQLSASYAGDSTYAATSSTPVNHTVIPGPPTISSFSPASALPGASVSINGTNFLSPFGSTAVNFNGASASISSTTNTRIVAIVPTAATTGPIQVTVADQSITSTNNFTVLVPPPPSITSFSPASGIYGTRVTINGRNFAGSVAGNTVAFNGVPATVVSATTTRIVAEVPTWSTTGRITVTAAGRTGTSATIFTVTSALPPPQISGFSPGMGVVGTPVTISGRGFSTVSAESNVVTFNGQTAFITQFSESQLAVLVPAGATSGPITVTVDQRTGVSTNPFTVIPTGTELATVSISRVDPEPSVVGQNFTIHIEVLPTNPDGPLPTGVVTVSDGVRGCQIILPTTTCPAMQPEMGESTLFAWYSGDSTYASAWSDSFAHITNPITATEICGFAPNVVPNDPPGFVPIEQLSGAVYSAGQTSGITGDGTLSVSFDPTLDGSSTADAFIDVTGTFHGPVNTGITVNGVVAQTVNGKFMAPNVRLNPGSNTLEAIATTLPGLTASASISLSRSGSEALLSLHAVQPIGMAPTGMHFDVELGTALSSVSLQTIRLDANGDGTFDHSASSLDQLNRYFGFSKPGLYMALVQVTTANGEVHTATQWVLIRNMAVERGAFCDVYGYLKARLLGTDPTAASRAYASSVRPDYLSGFTELGTDLPELVPELGTIVSGFAGLNYAEMLIMRDNDDQTRSGFHVHLVQDADGVWRISGM